MAPDERDRIVLESVTEYISGRIQGAGIPMWHLGYDFPGQREDWVSSIVMNPGLSASTLTIRLHRSGLDVGRISIGKSTFDAQDLELVGPSIVEGILGLRAG